MQLFVDNGSNSEDIMEKIASYTTSFLLLLLCLSASFSTAWAESQAVATVVALRGAAVAQNKSGASRNLSLKSQLFQEDILKTGSNGKLQLMFTDNSIISMGRDSEMKIAEYRWQSEQKDGALTMQVKEGLFRVMGGAIAKDAPQNFKTETPTSTIGIRGSMFAFKSTQDSLSVVFQGGRGIEVFNELGKVIITIPGFGTTVALNNPPAPPVKFTEQQINDLNSEANGNGNNGEQPAAGEEGGGEQSDAAPVAEGETETVATPEPQPLPPPVPVPPPPKPDPRDLNITFTTPPAPPSDGIFAFAGGLGGTSTKTDGSTETFSNTLQMGVNWHNHRIFGIAYDDSADKNKPVFFYGTVNGSTVSDIKIFGSDYDDTFPHDEDAFIRGNGTGLFSGSAYDFFSFNATGNSYLTKGSPTQTVLDSWTVAGGGQQVAGAMIPTAEKGASEIWSGFVVASSENMNNRPVGRHLIYNTNPNTFTMDINKDTGTILGTLTTDVNVGGGYNISGMTVGGSYGSVYLNDQYLAALLGGSNLAVKDYGSYMVVEDPAKQLSSHFTWGYWEVAYVDSSEQRQIRVPESMWLAGKPSTSSVINTSFSGTYSGKAHGTMIDVGTPTLISQVSGSMNLTADFTSTPSITGSINLITDVASNTTTSLSISGGAFSADTSSNRFNAILTGGTVQGAFYGTNAEAVGGSFYSLTGGKQYIGIFGGNK
ncbi:MAG: FecR domain-containing protein [Proteobacteria bacterium]|nr:FecR domain-containing protein [Pseudomonadota bacterium]